MHSDLRTFALAALASLAVACGGSDPAPPAPIGPSEQEPNGTPAQATALTLGSPTVGTIAVVTTVSVPGDADFYSFTVPAGGATVHVQTFDKGGAACGGGIDTFVEVYDVAETYVGTWDDTTTPSTLCEDFTVALPAGKNYVAVRGWSPAPFDYAVKVSIP